MHQRTHLLQAVQLAQAGDWDAAHAIAQDDSDHTANWLHAVLHKIEGDVWNSNYWYARSGGHQFSDYPDPQQELAAIAAALRS